MKRIVLSITVLAMFFIGCSKDDSNCESCTSDLGNKFEICENGDGTYVVSGKGDTFTLTEEDLLVFTPKETVELYCLLDE